MASQERLSVGAAAQRLGITSDAVRSRIKRGTLWAVRRNGRVQVVLRDMVSGEAAAARFAGPQAPANGATHGTADEGATAHEGATADEGTTADEGATADPSAQDPSNAETVTRLRTEIAHQKHRMRDMARERERLDRDLARLQRFLELEHALRARLQDQLDRLNERLSDALPEILDDPTERADRLWKRLGRQVERLSGAPGKRGD